MKISKITLEGFAGLLGFVTICAFGLYTMYGAVQGKSFVGINVTSWVMWCCLIALLWATAKRRGEDPLLVIGWTLATTAVTLGYFLLGAKWSFGTAEVVSVFCVVVAALAFLFSKEPRASYAVGLAFYISGIPQLLTFVATPAKETWWLWLFAAIATGLSLLSKKGFDLSTIGKAYDEKLFMERLTLFSQITFFVMVVR